MTEQNHIIETFSEMASRYESLMNSELNRFWGFNYADFIKELITDIDFNNQYKLLDIATGTAFIPQTLIKGNLPIKTIFGLDLTYEMLSNGKKQIDENKSNEFIYLVCSSAHAMPFRENTFDIITCCLATHHMNVSQLLDQAFSSLKPNGKIHIADVGGSNTWKIGIIRSFIKMVAFLYFLIIENFSRARAESEAIENILTIREWHKAIEDQGFISIKIRELKSKRFWLPNPVIIEAKKPKEIK